MGSAFRSDQMVLCELFLPSEAAFHCVIEFGETGLVQMEDMNQSLNNFQRRFVNEVRRCSEMERRLCYVENLMKKAGVPMAPAPDDLEVPRPHEMSQLEETFEKLEMEVKENDENEAAFYQEYLELTELAQVLAKTRILIDGETDVLLWKEPEPSDVIEHKGPMHLNFVTGLVARERMPAFERMVWRVCHGNVFMHQADIETPPGKNTVKSVFIISFSSDEYKTKVMKICDGFHATLYPIPGDYMERREMYMRLIVRVDDLVRVIENTRSRGDSMLTDAAPDMKTWLVKVRKMKASYHTLNLFNSDISRNVLIGRCWVPLADMADVRQALTRGLDNSGSTAPAVLTQIDTDAEPPTYNRTNKFTRAFQALIDSYGVASYRELSPMPYTIITFPFLFAVMFGDLGHGTIMFLFAAWMVVKEGELKKQKSDNEIWRIFFGGRYIILFMGLFSMYTGFIYNDVFSKSLNVFGSRWRVNYDHKTLEHNKDMQLDPGGKDYLQTPYPLGLDPIWQLSDNKIVFLNSYKMKISIIIGVIHMLFGVSLSFFNSINLKRKSNIITLFVPQIIFLVFLFLYLVILMFIKWIKYSASSGDVKTGTSCAPSVLITFINMVLFKSGSPNKGCDEFMFPGQGALQKFLVISAVLCIPWMLLAKPIVIMKKRKREALLKETNTDLESARHVTDHSEDEEDEEPISEVFIHQAIHTIEYVLGSVSHTASYLRLWALSLAHAQLAEVLWDMVLSPGINATSVVGGLMLYATFGFWVFLTIAILVLMEGLSAFLHTLRLHWVEFQSKFYEGLGYAFQPFSFRTILAAAENN